MRIRSFISQSVSTQGRVIDLDYRSGIGPRSAIGYVAVFTFSDVTGQQHTNRIGSAQNPPRHQAGDTAPRFMADDPAGRANSGVSGTLWAVPTFLGGFGVAFTAVGLLGFLAARKTDAPGAQPLSKPAYL